MSIDKLTSLVARVFFALAALTLLIGIVEKIANSAGYTIVHSYTPERLLELSVALSIFVSMLLLRQIRQQLRIGRGG